MKKSKIEELTKKEIPPKTWEFLSTLHERCWRDADFAEQRYKTFKQKVLLLKSFNYDTSEFDRHIRIYENDLRRFE